MKFVIFSDNPVVVKFIQECDPRFVNAQVVTGNAKEVDCAGNVVAGNLAFWLAATAVEVVAVKFTGDPPRGAEYTLKDMEAAGARLASYTVLKVEAGKTAISFQIPEKKARELESMRIKTELWTIKELLEMP